MQNLSFLSKLSQKVLNLYCRNPRLKNNLPDSIFLKWQWKNMMHYTFNWNRPNTLNEKIMWLKLNDRNPLHTIFVDKYEVKNWISNNIGNEMLIQTYQAYDDPHDIDITNLPNQFVLKCNHDSGTVFICRDKSSGIFYDKHMDEHDFNYVKQKLFEGLNRDYFLNAREWPYKNVKRKIIAEKLVLNKDGSLPNDYKLFYINGIFQFVYVSFDRAGVNDRCTYDKEWNRLPFVWVEPDVNKVGINTSDVPIPKSFPEMLEFADKIARYFRCVRIDLYDVDGVMYFGEVTPFHSAGYARFYPDHFDTYYGNKLII